MSETDKPAGGSDALRHADAFFAARAAEPDDEYEGPPRGPGPGLPEGLAQLVLKGVLWSGAFGLVLGSMESMVLAFTLKLPIGVLSFVLLGLLASLLMGAFGLGLGLLCSGTLVPLLHTRILPSRALAVAVATAAMGLFGFYFLQFAAETLSEGRIGPTLLLVFIPLFMWVVVFLNAGFALRKIERGFDLPPLGLGVGVLSVGAVLLGGALFSTRDTGGHGGLEGDPNVLLISVDTLRRDHVGLYGQTMGVPMPHVDRLADGGVVFDNAFTPQPETAPAHASLLTGLHPLRHRVLSNASSLSRGIDTLPRLLSSQGYATGAFVSSFALDARVGLAEGFHIYDDDLGSPVPGLARVRLVGLLLRAWMVLGDPASTPGFLERDGADTNARFMRWLDGHQDQPFFAMIHYFEPHAPYEPHGLPGFEANGVPGAPVVDHRARMSQGANYDDQERRKLRRTYAEEVARVDLLVGQVLDALDERGLTDSTMVIFVSDHGEMLGEHGLDFHHNGLFDPVLRVPLIMRVPGLDVQVPRVPAQVRSYDIFPTVLEFIGAQERTPHEGVSLLGYARGRLKKPVSAPLIGRRADGTGALVGLRHNDIKYVRDLQSGAERLYYLDSDPSEFNNLAGEALDTLMQARRIANPDAVALSKHLSVDAAEAGAATEAMLEALGYTQ